MLDSMTIGELAQKAGLSRRAVRFYVQQKLLPPPSGSGRGSQYDQSHLERLRQVAEFQTAGYSLAAIRKIVDGETTPSPPPRQARRISRPVLSADLWTRVQLAEGVELHFDASRHRPDVSGLLALKEMVQQVFCRNIEDSTEKKGDAK
jgi:DNA-binding transcriptional MerR regulator